MIAEHTNNRRLVNVAEVFDEFPESIIARLYKRKVFIRFIVVFRYGCRVNTFVKIDAACRISAVVLHCHVKREIWNRCVPVFVILDKQPVIV